MSSTTSNKVLLTTLVVFALFGMFGSPLFAVSAYLTAGGPYEGNVGEEIAFDANNSTLSDGSPIEGFYWDWNGDGQWDEAFTLPQATHTWYSAFSGYVRVYVYHADGVDWADAAVTVHGPETALALTTGSSMGLYLTADQGGGLGINADTGLFDQGLTGATITLVPPTNALGEPDEDAPINAWNTQYTVPLTNGSDYTATLTSSQSGPFDLQIQGLQDGEAVSNQFVSGQIFAGEEVEVDVSVSVTDGKLVVVAASPVYFPVMKVTPDDGIDLVVQPGGRYGTTISVAETGGLRPLSRVAITSSELASENYSIPVSDISFSPNGFDVPAGGSQEVIMTVNAPEFFIGQVTGTVTVTETASGQSEEIDVTVRKAGKFAPIVEVVSPVYGVVGSPAEFDATGSYDPDGSIVSYCWDWDLTGQYECVEGFTIEHTWNRAFSGVVHLRVTDNDGHTTDQYVPVVISD